MNIHILGIYWGVKMGKKPVSWSLIRKSVLCKCVFLSCELFDVAVCVKFTQSVEVVWPDHTKSISRLYIAFLLCVWLCPCKVKSLVGKIWSAVLGSFLVCYIAWGSLRRQRQGKSERVRGGHNLGLSSAVQTVIRPACQQQDKGTQCQIVPVKV